jgi:hypothetical protein
MNVRGAHTVRQNEINRAETLVPQSSTYKFHNDDKNMRRYKSLSAMLLLQEVTKLTCLLAPVRLWDKENTNCSFRSREG